MLQKYAEQSSPQAAQENGYRRLFNCHSLSFFQQKYDIVKMKKKTKNRGKKIRFFSLWKVYYFIAQVFGANQCRQKKIKNHCY